MVLLATIFCRAADPTVAELMAGIQQRVAGYMNYQFTLEVESNSLYSVVFADTTGTTISESKWSQDIVSSRDIFRILSPESAEYPHTRRSFERYMKSDLLGEWELFYSCYFDGKKTSRFERNEDDINSLRNNYGFVAPGEQEQYYAPNIYDEILTMYLNGSPGYRRPINMNYTIQGTKQVDGRTVYVLFCQARGNDYRVEITGSPEFIILLYDCRVSGSDKIFKRVEITKIGQHEQIWYPASGSYHRGRVTPFCLPDMDFSFQVTGVESIPESEREMQLTWPAGTGVRDLVGGNSFNTPTDVERVKRVFDKKNRENVSIRHSPMRMLIIVGNVVLLGAILFLVVRHHYKGKTTRSAEGDE